MKFTHWFMSALLLASGSAALALEIKPYNTTALAEAQQAGKPVALHFHAEWCPTCKAQAKSLAALKAEPGLDMLLLVADYDTEKALKTRFKVRSQSTLVVLHGDQERARLVGDTSADAIRTALKSGL